MRIFFCRRLKFIKHLRDSLWLGILFPYYVDHCIWSTVVAAMQSSEWPSSTEWQLSALLKSGTTFSEGYSCAVGEIILLTVKGSSVPLACLTQKQVVGCVLSSSSSSTLLAK